MTAPQLLGWERYAAVEPFDETRADWRAAQIAAMVYNMAVDGKHRKEIGEFLLKFGPSEGKRRKQTVEEQLQILNILAMTGGARST